jgi:transcriptional regulator with XRE-family HTH domain
VRKEHNQKVGELIRDIRNAYAQDQEEFAQRIRVSRSTLSRYENGLVPKRSVLSTLWHLAISVAPEVSAELWNETHDASERMPLNFQSEAVIAVPSVQLQELRMFIHELSEHWGKVSDRLTESDAKEALAIEKRLRSLMGWTYRWIR